MSKARQIVDKLLEAMDPDDPESFVRSQPGFKFRQTQYMGEQVFVVGPGEDTSDWPENIGCVIEGPEPLPPYRQQRWYVTDVRGIPQHRLEEYNLGLRYFPGLRTFDTKEDAALAIWLIRSRLPEKKSVLKRRRPYKVSEAEDEDEASEAEILRYFAALPAKSGLRRYSREEIRRYLATRPPVQPEEPGEPHQIVGH